MMAKRNTQMAGYPEEPGPPGLPADPTPQANPTPPANPTPTAGPIAPPMTAEAIKAFAHPLRTAMYQFLTAHGSATASQLARHLGESTGQTSYHLRQLERHGLIEDDPEKADVGGRERWWRTVSFSLDPRAFDDPAARTAATVALRAVVAERARTLQAWFDTGDTAGAWVDGALHREIDGRAHHGRTGSALRGDQRRRRTAAGAGQATRRPGTSSGADPAPGASDGLRAAGAAPGPAVSRCLSADPGRLTALHRTFGQ